MGAKASQITGVSIVCTTGCSGADQRKHQSSTPLAFVRGIHRWPVGSPKTGPVMRENASIWWRHHEVLLLLLPTNFPPYAGGLTDNHISCEIQTWTLKISKYETICLHNVLKTLDSAARILCSFLYMDYPIFETLANFNMSGNLHSSTEKKIVCIKCN